MTNCKANSKKLCSECKHFGYCDIAKRCDGKYHNCDITDCENNPSYNDYANKEYMLDDGYGDYITFNIIETNIDREIITVAVTYLSKITISAYNLYEDENGLYFKYGPSFVNVYLSEFQTQGGY